jgi:AcrR family transcriptional regulator
MGQDGQVRNATEQHDQAPRSQPQQARSRDKLDRILMAAAQLLGELPYDEVGTRLIAERAGVSVGSLYRFFPDKDSIVQALLAAWLEDFTGIVYRAADGELPDQPAAFLEQLIDSCAEFFRREPGFQNAFYHGQRSPELKEAQRRNDYDLSVWLYDLLKTRYGLPDPGLKTRCLIAVQVSDYLLGLAFRDNAGGDRTVLDEAKRLLCLYLGA